MDLKMSGFEKNNNLKKRQSTTQKVSNSVEDLTENTANICTPTELLTEFLSSIMVKDYERALNYCAQILSYEPGNSTAQEFYPLIVQKLEMKFDSSTSESSETDSLSSSESFEDRLFQNNILKEKFSQETNENYSSLQYNNTRDKFSDVIALNLATPQTEIVKTNKETIAATISLHPRYEDNFGVPKKEAPKLKKVRNETHLSSVPPKRKTSLKSDNFSHKKVKKLTKSKQEKELEEKQTISPKQTSTKILLQATKTMTFPKELPPGT